MLELGFKPGKSGSKTFTLPHHTMLSLFPKKPASFLGSQQRSMSDWMRSAECYFPAPAVKKQTNKQNPDRPRGLNATVGLANKQSLDCFQLENKDI